jgi:hypothetical protein
MDSQGETFTADQVRDMLRRECQKAGGMRSWGREHGVNVAYVSDTLRRTSDVIPDVIAAAFGLKRHLTYRLDSGDKHA